GENGSGQLGDGTTIAEPDPIRVSGLGDGTGVAAGGDFSLALSSSGQLLGWGANDNNQLADPASGNRLSPIPITPMAGAVAISAGQNHALAITSDRTLWTWGGNGHGQLGDGRSPGVLPRRSTPGDVVMPPAWSAVSMGGSTLAQHTIAITTDGQ